MRSKIGRYVILVTALAFSMAIYQGSLTAVSASVSPDVAVTIRVSEKGFFDHKGRPVGPKNPIKISKGKRVKITFVFDEALNSLAIGDAHQIAITADDRWTIESKKIWLFNKETSLTFVAGENGRKEYRGYCIIDCIGMDHLKNLVIKVT